MNFLNTFRGRLLIILAFLLIATLGVQYFLNLRTQEENNELREMQERALVRGIALGFNGMQSTERLGDFIDQEGQPFFDEKTKNRIKDIIIISPEWEIYDSLNPDYVPYREGAETRYRRLIDLSDLPPLMEANSLGEDAKQFPNASLNPDGEYDGEAHAIPIETNQGRYYVMVILKTDKYESAKRAARPLVYMLLVLSLSTAITIILVWRFTRPVSELSTAARRIAQGDLSVRVKAYGQRNEMGKLARQFNEMTAQLERKQELESKLQEAEKSAVVGRLGSAIAHEIRNPLNYINLTLDHLRYKFSPADPDQRKGFEKLTSQLKTEVARINGQIGDFLSYSRPANPELRPLEIRGVIEDSLRLVEGQAEELGIKVSLVEHEDVPRILGDAEYLRSVFNNLFINAVQAMEGGKGKLSVRITPDGDRVAVEVADTGKGIPEENFPKIFEPYFSTKATGTGLGLAIVHKIIDVHNGTIDVESHLNEGTRFVVRLPKADQG